MAVGGHPTFRTIPSIPEIDATLETYNQDILKNIDFLKQLQYIAKIQSINTEEPDLQVASEQHYDGVIVYAAFDKKRAEDTMNFMNRLTLEKDEHPKVCLFDKAEFDGSDIKRPAILVERCSLVLLLLTDNFEHDETVQFLNEEAVANTRFGPVKPWQKYSVRPLHTQPKKERKYPTPFGLASIRSYDVYDFNDEHTKSAFKDLFQHHLFSRKKREADSKKRKEKRNKEQELANNNEEVDDGESINLQVKDGRIHPSESLSGKGTHQVLPSDASDNNQGNEYTTETSNSNPGASVQEETDDRLGTQLLSELSLQNDYITMMKSSHKDNKVRTTGHLKSVDLYQTRLKEVCSAEPSTLETQLSNQRTAQLSRHTDKSMSPPESVIYMRNQDKNSLGNKSLDTMIPGERNPNSLDTDLNKTANVNTSEAMDTSITKEKYSTANGESEEEGDRDHLSSMETQFDVKSLPEGSTPLITEGIMSSVSAQETEKDEDEHDDGDDDDVEVDKTFEKEGTSDNSELNDLASNENDTVNAETDKNSSSSSGKSVTGCEMNFNDEESKTHVEIISPDQTPLQGSSDHVSQPTEKQMSLCKDITPSSSGNQRTSTEETSEQSKAVVTSSSDSDDADDDTNTQKSASDNHDIKDVFESEPANVLISDCLEAYKYTTITERTLTASEPAFNKDCGLSASPASEYTEFPNGIPLNHGTSGEGIYHKSTEDEQGTKSSYFSGGVSRDEETEFQNTSTVAGTQLPDENVTKTIVYIYNSNNIQIQGENNVHYKNRKKPESQNEQKKDVTSKMTPDEGIDPGWVPPNRKKKQQQTIDDKSADQSSAGQISKLKMLTQGGSVTDEPSSADAVSSSSIQSLAALPTVDTEDKKLTEALTEDSKSSYDTGKVSRAYTGEIQACNCQDGKQSTKKKSKTRGCFPFRFKRRKRKKDGVTES